MRELTEGWEAADVTVTGWTVDSGTAARVSGAGNQNLDGSGNGGTYYLGFTAANTKVYSPNTRSYEHSTVELREGYFRAYLYTDADVFMAFVDNAVVQFTVLWDSADQRVKLYRGDETTLVATSAGTVSANAWHRFEVHYYCDQTAGDCDVYVDDNGTYSTATVSFNSGDTAQGAGDTFNSVYVGGDGTTRADDVALNSISVQIDGVAGGTPAAGDSITWGASGAATVSGYMDNGDNSGRLILHQSNHEANPITDNLGITDGTWTAAAVVPNGFFQFGVEPNSTFPGPGFIQYKLVDGSVEGQINLTGTDLNQIDNHLMVDDQPVDTTTEGVVADTTGEYDIYSSSSTLPSSANSINHIDVVSYALKDGATINDLNGRVRISSVNYDSEAIFDAAVAVSAGIHTFPFQTNPDTGGAWTADDIDALEFGVRMQA